jgi:glutathione S-transferase
MHGVLALVTLLSLFVYLWTCVRVGHARVRYGVAAPATTGDPVFERCYRVQCNTLEWLVVFLPALWLFCLFVDRVFASALGDAIGSGLGLVWAIGRVLYGVSYVRDPAKRGPGFGVQALATLLLLLGALVAVIWTLTRP